MVASINYVGTGYCRIFATGMFQTSSKCYDRAVLLLSRPIVLFQNKEKSWVFKVLLQRFCIVQSKLATDKTLDLLLQVTSIKGFPHSVATSSPLSSLLQVLLN